MIKFTGQEENLLYSLIEEVTGTSQKGSYKKDVLIMNIERRMSILCVHTLPQYLIKLSEDDEEYDHFVSMTTIHTTYWFRENPHFQIIEEDIIKRLNSVQGTLNLRLWSSACSTGQEVYSLILILEKLLQKFPRFNYEIYGSDIDSLSVAKARAAKYSLNELKTIPLEYHRFLEIGKDSFTLKDNLKRKVKFFTSSLTDDASDVIKEKIDYIFCRNVLIYFEPKSAMKVIRGFEKFLAQDGLLVLGHSENFETSLTKFKLERNACFRFKEKELPELSLSSEDILKNFRSPQIIVIGASTGGPETLEKFLRNFPKPCPPVVVIQHINSMYSESIARRLAAISGLEFIDTNKKTPIKQNGLHMPLGDYHLQVVEERGVYFLQPNTEPLRNGHRASADVLFESIARIRIRAIGVLLTGMGKDGAEGLLKMKRTNRCLTMAQNKESSVVFGMPREAINMGAVHIIGSDKYLSQCVRDYSQNKFEKKKAG
jgi:chemotaxis methyl-accepting protein methylase